VLFFKPPVLFFVSCLYLGYFACCSSIEYILLIIHSPCFFSSLSQVNVPVFREPYNSVEIGLCKVSILQVCLNFTCSPEDVHSKCFVLSTASKIGTTHEPDMTNLDPLPTAAKDALKSKNSSNFDIHDAYYDSFRYGPPDWIVQSLLLPGSDS
jgi:hypothetical protein